MPEAQETPTKRIRELDFSIFFFASGEESILGNGYRLLLDSARFADAHDFRTVWVPERHFTRFGCLYPNPSVLAAAIAAVTEKVRICAGSVVMPLHSPIRVAEEWSVVDNLSQGRIGLSIASGWNPDDFILVPERYAERKGEMYRGLETVQRIWSGERVHGTNGAGERVELDVYPTPFQERIPVWITAAGSPSTFEKAGELGANLLTHMLDQDLETLAGKIARYRAARAAAGHDPEAGEVTVMLHTFVGEDADAIREEAREPYCNYLKNNLGLAKGLAYNRGYEIDFDAFSESDLDEFLNFLYDRFAFERALIGSPETCTELVGNLFAIGADEIACLLDFGPREDRILENLPHLDTLRQRCLELADEDYPRRLTGEGIEPAAAPAAAPQDGSPLEIRAEWKSSLEELESRLEEELGADELYATLEERGLEVPGELRPIASLKRRDGESLAYLALPEESEAGERASWLLEGAVQAVVAALAASDGSLIWAGRLRRGWPASVPDGVAYCHAHLAGDAGAAGDGAVEADVRFLDGTGADLGSARLELTVPQESSEVGEESVAEWLYEMSWEVGEPEEPAGEETGTVVILADRSGVGDALAERLAAEQVPVVTATVEEVMEDLEEARRSGDTRGKALAPLLDRVAEEELPPCRRIVHLWSLDMTGAEGTDAATLLEDQVYGVESALQLIQAMAVREMADVELHLVTRGVQPVGDGAGRLETPQSPLWSLGRTCAAEYPNFWGGLVDLDPAVEAERAADELLASLRSPDGEDQVAFRDGVRHVARMTRVEPPPPHTLTADPEGAYLVTGGLQGIGAETARWLVARGARYLVLVGRTELPPREAWTELAAEDPVRPKVEVVRELEALGVTVEHPAVDVSREDRVRAFLEERRAAGRPPIRGVFHAATVWRDADGNGIVGPLAQITLSSFDLILPPKLAGGWLLAQLAEEEPLDFLFLFSAGAALMGPAGQGNYAAANIFLDLLAHDVRRRTGCHAVAVDWGPVFETGFGATPEGAAMHSVWERRGILSLSPEQMIDAMELVLGESPPQVAVLRTNWELLSRAYADTLSAPWASRLVEGRGVASGPDVVALLHDAAPEERRETLARHLQGQVVTVLGLPPEETPAFDQGLFDLGMDSLLALELKNRIQSALRRDFPATAVFDYPTLESLAGYLLDDVLELDTGAADDGGAGPAEEVDLVGGVEDLSEEEVERLLAEKTAGGGTP